jgi:cysteinyl-tRNA synthetase
MYVCGPTVYNYIHIGNARAFVFFDVVRRYLRHIGYQVTYVQNITDVDDKLINASRETGETVEAIAERYMHAFHEDMGAIGAEKPDSSPRATEHITEMVEAIEALIEKGYAYESNGDVYFRSLQKKDYGKLSHQSLDELKSGARIEINEQKDHQLDFVLWKKAKPGEVSWDSPWGPGRPGWHIECSVMSRKYLGDTLDIHGGGVDLCFPHHENEIAQSETWTEQPFVQYWMHNGFVNMGSEKMSKSLGNVERVVTLRAKYSPEAIRYFLLSAHYRSPIQFSDEIMEQCEGSADRIRTAMANLQHRREVAVPGPVSDDLRHPFEELTEKFYEAMDDDFNTANAIAVLFDAVKVSNEFVAKPTLFIEEIDYINEWMKTFGGEILGLVPREITEDI